MTLNGYFALNSVFAPVCLASTVRHSKNNCEKTNREIDMYFQQCKSSSGTVVSGNIRSVRILARVSGSLERRR